MKRMLSRLAVLLALACCASAAWAQETTNAAPRHNVTTSLFSMSTDTNRGGMTITSERLELDYKEFVVAFDENVHVTDPQFVMTADRVLVFLENTNQIKRIIALGNVVISQTDRHATCDKAVYEKGTEQVTLTGSPVLTRGNDRVTGSEIVVYMNDQRVVVKNGRMIISPETMKNRDVKP